jgi:CMP-N-acetylneuraminic acid synthetase
MKYICIVINARVNSSRCYKKMIEPIGDTCLIELILDKLKKSNIPNKDIFIASPDEEINEIVNKYNFNFIKRSKESNDEEKDIRIIFEWYKILIEKYSHVLIINPCLPLLKIETINKFYIFCKNQKYDRIFTIKENKNYFFDKNNKPINFQPGILNTKYVEPLIEGGHCLYLTKLEDIKNDNYLGKFVDESNPYLYKNNENELYDIDHQYQFDIIKYYIKENIDKILSN